jgi:hypothetical protein
MDSHAAEASIGGGVRRTVSWSRLAAATVLERRVPEAARAAIGPFGLPVHLALCRRRSHQTLASEGVAVAWRHESSL